MPNNLTKALKFVLQLQDGEKLNLAFKLSCGIESVLSKSKLILRNDMPKLHLPRLLCIIFLSGSVVGDCSLGKAAKASDMDTTELNKSLCQQVEASSSVEVNGLRFEVCMQSPTVTISKSKSSSSYINFGIRITNISHKPIRIDKSAKLNLEVIGKDGKALKIYPDFGRFKVLNRENYPLLSPGNSDVVLVEGRLSWTSSSLVAHLWNKGLSEYQYLTGLSLGKHQIRFTYENSLVDGGIKESIRSQFFPGELWIGRATTSFADFSLITP